jgi:P-type Cu+ transporter
VAVAEAPARSTDTMEPVTLAIAGMTCGACAARIERRLNALDGVKASVNYATERASAQLAPSVPPTRLLEAIESAGFTAQVVDEGRDIDSQRAEADRRVHTLGRRLVVSALLLMPLSDLSLAFWLFPQFRFPGWQWVLLVLATPVVTWAAWPFYTAAVRGARHGTTTMDTLVSIGIAAATCWSLYAMFWVDTGHQGRSGVPLLHWRHLPGGAIYLEVAVGVTTFLLAGRYFEALSRRRATSALRSLAAVGARHVTVLDPNGEERRAAVDELEVGDRFVVRPGETVATDGVVESGRAAIDRSAMTGESLALETGAGDDVIGGTVSLDGRLVVRATKVGRDTQLANMLRLVEEAQNQKAGAQQLADRISSVFVPVVLAMALATLAGWLSAGAAPVKAFGAALSVLIIACPCALGLATPMALFVASGRAARLGIFFKGHRAIEASRQVDTVLLDKTGTVTRGEMVVTAIEVVPGEEPSEVLRLAGAVEQASEHLAGRAIAAAAQQAGELPPADCFVARPGFGARAMVAGHEVAVGRSELFDGDEAISDALLACRDRWGHLGSTTAFIACDGAVVGAVALADEPKPSAAPAVQELERLGLHCTLLTGDNERAARTIGRAIGIADVVAGALPEDKVAVIRRLQAEGRTVAMVGDGINDGPALATADLGLAVGSGTDVARNAADLLILRDDLRVVATAINLSRQTVRTIRGNLVWAFAYNVAAIPLAACGFLNPFIAGAAMAFSSGFVVWNSSRLRHVGADFPQLAPEPDGPAAESVAPAARLVPAS